MIEPAGPTAWHEAGHLAAAAALGWKLRGATVVAGDVWGGCAKAVPEVLPDGITSQINLDLPFAAWPCEARQRLEVDVIYSMSGDVARLCLSPRPEPGWAARELPPLAESALDMAKELPAGGEIVAEFAAAVSGPGMSDEERVAWATRVAHGTDVASAATWLGYLQAQARSLALANRDRIGRLAVVLQMEGTVSGELAARVLELP